MKRSAASDADLPPQFRKPREERPLEQIPLRLPQEEEIPSPPPPPKPVNEGEVDPFLRRGPEVTGRREDVDR